MTKLTGATPHGAGRSQSRLFDILSTLVIAIFACGVLAPVAQADSSSIAGNGELQPILADQARPAFALSPATEIRYHGRRVSAMPYLVRVDAPAAHAASETDNTTVYAYSLALGAGPAGAGTWAAVSPNTRGIGDLRPASYIANLGNRSALKDIARELTARQVAIWHYTNGLPIDRFTVPAESIRRRALLLTRAAAHGRAPDETNPISVGISASLAGVELRQITIGVLLSIDGENSYCHAQKLDIRVNGRWGVIKTGAQTNLQYSGPRHLVSSSISALPGAPCDGGPSRDFDQARFTLPRPQIGTSVEIDWNIILAGINVFENGSAPPLLVVGGTTPNLEYRQVLPLDPSSFPTAHNYLERFLTNVIATFHGIWAILLLLLLLALAPAFSHGVQVTAIGAGRFAIDKTRASLNSRSPETTATNPDSDSKQSPDAAKDDPRP